MSWEKHKFKRVGTGTGIESTITPTCSCGWTGRPEGAWNDWQHTNVAEQEQAHILNYTKDAEAAARTQQAGGEGET